MTFDVHIARCASLGDVRDAPEVARGVFRDLAEALGGTRVAENIYRVDTDEGVPWFFFAWHHNVVRLSVSYGHPDAVELIDQTIELAPTLAKRLGARAFEDVFGRELTEQNASGYATDVDFIGLQTGGFDRMRRASIDDYLAPLELPIGQCDYVSEFLLFHVAAASYADDLGLEHAIAATCPSMRVERFDDRIELRNEDGIRLTSIARGVERLQIRPIHEGALFAEKAAVTIRVANAVAKYEQAELLLNGAPWIEVRENVLERANGLGNALYEWWKSSKGTFIRSQYPDRGFVVDLQVAEANEKLAHEAVSLAERHGFKLDFTEQTFELAVRFLDHARAHNAGNDPQWVELLARHIGAYLGEVVRRSASAEWGFAFVAGTPHDAVLSTGFTCPFRPVLRCRRRLIEPKQESDLPGVLLEIMRRAREDR